MCNSTDVRMCPECGYDKSKVYDVRDQIDGVVLRRRRCLSCGCKWRTVEVRMQRYEDLLKGEIARGGSTEMAESGRGDAIRPAAQRCDAGSRHGVW